VIAFDRGSMRELIDDGVTGMLVTDAAGASEAVARVEALDRASIRATAVSRFSSARMVDAYVSVYEQLLATRSVAARDACG
jgi:glycosyltransferase involved in cell wall biosynthesis